MRAYVQWTRRNPRDWEEFDTADWATLPLRPVPATGEIGGKDNKAGWPLSLNIQGIDFGGHDHYAVEDIVGGVRVTIWDDDPDDPLNVPWAAARWTLLEPAPDMRRGGRMNTSQRVEYWHDAPVLGRATGGLHVTHPRAEFVAPADARHGVWVTDAKLAEHKLVRSLRTWHEWLL